MSRRAEMVTGGIALVVLAAVALEDFRAYQARRSEDEKGFFDPKTDGYDRLHVYQNAYEQQVHENLLKNAAKERLERQPERPLAGEAYFVYAEDC